ncbi:MAG: biosynthetic-type acetolactate synthase large subunit [Nevskiaceae bacterium]|jgi:acetolactate synthase-1/2/3 large subunit|nr:biosynthetic-type acetolactate synthase large subunit [Nevskiaceae bacterium]
MPFRPEPIEPPCNGAELIVHLLEQQGVRIIAGIPGGTLLPLYEALGNSSAIAHVLPRHEQAAGFIAQGIARITGKAGVCLATSGPGVTNIITAIADAKLDSVPLICIAGQVPTHLIGTDAFQEVRTIEMVRPITKACFFVQRAEELVRVIPEAFRIAESGRPGPVLIDIPKNVQMQRWEHSVLPETAASLTAQQPAAQTHRSASAIHFDRAIEMIDHSSRPVLYVGGGVVKARAHELVRELAQRLDIPVVTTLMALGTLASEHRLNLGMPGMHAARYTNRVIDECDLLIAIGARFDDRATGTPEHFAARARIIHIDVDERELGKIKQPALAIACDAHTALTELLRRTSPAQRPAWLSRIRQLRAAYPLRMPRVHELCSPYGIVRAVSELAPRDCLITTDVGQHQMWVAQAFAFSRPDRWLTSGGLGTMGFGLPAAIGAVLAQPDATALCFTGDGSLQMNIQELATLAELNLDVKIILLDNAALGLVRQQQELFHRRRFVASQYEQPPRFTAIAEAFGVPAIDLGRSAAPRAALAAALREKGPMLVRVPIDASEHALPMVKPGAANSEAVDHA